MGCSFSGLNALYDGIPGISELCVFTGLLEHFRADAEIATIIGHEAYKVLMDEFHHVSTAFQELNRSYQEAIEDITMRMGAGMAKFISKEPEDWDNEEDGEWTAPIWCSFLPHSSV